MVRADVESEFIDSNHTNCLLLRQLFKQAEKWHLKLNVDTSELENKGLLDEVAKLEDTSMSSTSLRNESKGKLIPLEESGTDFYFAMFLLMIFENLALFFGVTLLQTYEGSACTSILPLFNFS